MIKKYLSIISFFLLFIIFVPESLAQEKFYKAEYDVVHKLQSDYSINTKLVINLINLRADVYVTKFSILIPTSSNVSDLKVFSPSGEVSSNDQVDQKGTTITFNFKEPVRGKNQSNLLEISFNQAGLVQKDGKTLEALLPTFANDHQTSRVTFDTVTFVDNQLSIAKPRPSKNEKTVFTWDNVSIPMVYVVFGQYQLYKTRLNYLLYNNRLTPVKQDIAFPPETLRQSVFVKKITPKPNEIIVDEDGNYLGRYILSPQEKKIITFEGTVKIFAKDQEDMIHYIRLLFKSQKNYLLTQEKYWTINNPQLLKSLEKVNTTEDVFNFVVDKLDYSFSRFGNSSERLGAEAAFVTPGKAVCMEYTDLFIGASREKGIYAREIQGYGYSKDPRLRPQSLQGDVLHAWPEFYDLATERWVQVDPTWADTSGIDYLHGTDLNHIAFAIHGKNSVYPLPAGMYKNGNTKDVYVKTTIDEPMNNESVKVRLDFGQQIISGKQNNGTIQVINTGNTFIKNIPLSLSSETLEVSPALKTIFLIAPSQTIKIPISFITKNKIVSQPEISITIGSLYTNTVRFKLISEKVQGFLSLAKFAFLAFILIAVLSLILRRV
ncbi:hypothetical protein A2690_02580 [Candidatus Roizmanbacteria bacterium RIFCSPHIGHO2_01_FULL_39_12b]|uniref:Transglutaminase-like domain-containing protein n=1 Tax=Candidatus Roizmanbacteria bacterium RIFCSPHIGHO2_01_FULL_39_12b TaxID=1802030 RepID=A0A1F7GCC0_9BACT|nr:MAG: hypothetical protein A2690_02580 [Candidatus Roizmanbacteria bacterium RIFCSPHIGHO2_01_FULL_39_12b]